MYLILRISFVISLCAAFLLIIGVGGEIQASVQTLIGIIPPHIQKLSHGLPYLEYTLLPVEYREWLANVAFSPFLLLALFLGPIVYLMKTARRVFVSVFLIAFTGFSVIDFIYMNDWIDGAPNYGVINLTMNLIGSAILAIVLPQIMWLVRCISREIDPLNGTVGKLISILCVLIFGILVNGVLYLIISVASYRYPVQLQARITPPFNIVYDDEQATSNTVVESDIRNTRSLFGPFTGTRLSDKSVELQRYTETHRLEWATGIEGRGYTVHGQIYTNCTIENAIVTYRNNDFSITGHNTNQVTLDVMPRYSRTPTSLTLNPLNWSSASFEVKENGLHSVQVSPGDTRGTYDISHFFDENHTSFIYRSQSHGMNLFVEGYPYTSNGREIFPTTISIAIKLNDVPYLSTLAPTAIPGSNVVNKCKVLNANDISSRFPLLLTKSSTRLSALITITQEQNASRRALAGIGEVKVDAGIGSARLENLTSTELAEVLGDGIATNISLDNINEARVVVDQAIIDIPLIQRIDIMGDQIHLNMRNDGTLDIYGEVKSAHVNGAAVLKTRLSTLSGNAVLIIFSLVPVLTILIFVLKTARKLWLDNVDLI